MWQRLRPRLGPTTRLLLGLAGILLLLQLVAALWWWLPPRARVVSIASGKCHRLEVSADGTTLATLTTDEEEQAELALWHAASGEKLASRPVQWNLSWKEGAPYSAAFHHLPMVRLSPDGQSVVYQEPYADNGGRVLVWNVASGSEPIVLPKAWTVLALSWPQRVLVASSVPSELSITSLEEPIKVWDLNTGQERPAPPFKLTPISTLADGRIVVFDTNETPDAQSVKLWDLMKQTEICNLPGTAAGDISGDGRIMPIHCKEGIRVWDLSAGKARTTIPEHELLEGLNYDGTRALTRNLVPDESINDGRPSFTNRSKLWDLATVPPRELGTFEAKSNSSFIGADGKRVDYGRPLTFSRDGKWLKTEPAGMNILANVWNAMNPEEDGLTVELIQAEFSPDSRSIAGFGLARGMMSDDPMAQSPAGWMDVLQAWLGLPSEPNQDYELLVFALEAGRMMSRLGPAGQFAYFPDGKSIVLAREHGAIEIWDIPPRRPGWIEYGLPTVFLLLVLLGCWQCVRFWRKIEPQRNGPSLDSTSCSADSAP